MDRIGNLLRLAVEETKAGNYHKAIKTYKKIITECAEDEPDIHLIYWKIGEIYLDNRQYEEAKYNLSKAVELDPSNAGYHYLLGSICRYTEEVDKSIYHLTKAAELDDSRDIIWRELGWVVGHFRDPEKGIEYIKRAIKLNPSNSRALTDIAMLYAAINKWNEALLCIEEALKHDPDNQRIAAVGENLRFFKSEFERLNKSSQTQETVHNDRQTTPKNTSVRKRSTRAVNKGQTINARKTIFQFKISLRDIEPEIWRRIEVPASYSFWDLHVAIQDAMGWLDYHLHSFQIRDSATHQTVEIGIPDEDDPDDDILPGWEIPIKDYFVKPGNQAVYEYDFGDGWEHVVTLEKISERIPKTRYPNCLDGARACPPEDCGGSCGYEHLLETMKDPSCEDYDELMEWLGEGFEPEAFSPKQVRFDNPAKRWDAAFIDAP